MRSLISSQIFNGQADGLQCRSLEIFDSFGFADRVWKESNHMLEVSWPADSSSPWLKKST